MGQFFNPLIPTMKRILLAFLVVCYLPSLAGCSTYGFLKKTEEQVTGYAGERPTEDEVHVLADANSRILNRKYAAEAQLRGTSYPAVCLALSGGGIRSAAYSTGVLKAITEEKQSLDIISSVSGGSYAASWYYLNMAHALRNKIEPNSIFSDDYVYRFTNREFIETSKAFFTTVTLLPFSVLSGVSRNTFGLGELDLSWYAEDYAKRINLMFYKVAKFEPPEYPKLGTDIKQFHLPNLIINTTITGMNDDSLPLSSRVFEFTPFHYGSDGYGYLESTSTEALPRKDRPLQSLSSIVATSAAALDVELTGTAYWGRKFLATTLGMPVLAIENRHKDLFHVRYFFLSDGGHSENLGAYSLIRRRCGKIFIVDAAWDPNYQFVEYKDLQKALLKQRINLSVKQIDHKDFDDWKFPIMEGSVSTIPVYNGEGAQRALDEKALTIVYFKMSLGTQYGDHVIQYPEGLTPDAELCADRPWFWRRRGCFPHIPTSDQGIDRRVLQKLFTLGYIHAKTYLARGRTS
jgi:hypothetical protein